MVRASSIPCKSTCRLHRVAENRLADPARVDVVEIEVQLCDNTEIGPTLPVDGNQRFDTELEGLPNPDDPGVDGASRPGAGGECVRDGRLQVCFDQRDQMIDEIR